MTSEATAESHRGRCSWTTTEIRYYYTWKSARDSSPCKSDTGKHSAYCILIEVVIATFCCALTSTLRSQLLASKGAGRRYTLFFFTKVVVYQLYWPFFCLQIPGHSFTRPTLINKWSKLRVFAIKRLLFIFKVLRFNECRHLPLYHNFIMVYF